MWSQSTLAITMHGAGKEQNHKSLTYSAACDYTTRQIFNQSGPCFLLTKKGRASCCEWSFCLSRLNKKNRRRGEEPRQRASQGAAGYKWDSAVLNSKSHKIKKKMGSVRAHTDKHTHLKFNFNSLIYILFQKEEHFFSPFFFFT